MPRNKNSQNFKKIMSKFLFFWGDPGRTREWLGGPTGPPHHMVARQPCGRATTWCGTSRSLQFTLLHPLPFSLPTKHIHLKKKSCSCCCCPRILDLLAQPIFAAEIWGICSPVCDSSDHPNRILFSGLYLEYFAAVDVMLSEFKCVF